MTKTLEDYAKQLKMYPSGLAQQIRSYIENKDVHTIYGAVPNATLKYPVNNARIVLLDAKNKGNYDDIMQQTETILTFNHKPIWSNDNDDA